MELLVLKITKVYKMGLHKGNTNNLGGRPKGIPNKVTASLRNRINDFLADNWENLQKDFDKIDPKDRLQFYEKLLQYGLPRLQNTTLSTDLERLSDDQLDYIIQNLQNGQAKKN